MINPPLITWTQDYAIGHQSLDEEHRRLVATINRLHAAETEGVKGRALEPLLRAVELATIEHFRHENAVLTLELHTPLGDEMGNEHFADHARSFAQLESIIHRINAGETFAAHELSRTLGQWFVEHVVGHDAPLKKTLQANAANEPKEAGR